MVLLDFSMSPLGKGESVSPYVARCLEVVVPSGLFVLTARHGTAETGMLVSWVQQCSFDPPLITVALKRGRSMADLLAGPATFVLNILDNSQTDMVVHFGRGFELGEPAFVGL